MAFYSEINEKIGGRLSQTEKNVLGVCRKDRVTIAEVRPRTIQRSMHNILRERRLCWLEHVIRMDRQRIPQLALYWEVPGCMARGPGGLRTNWKSTINKTCCLTWEEAAVAALNRQEWMWPNASTRMRAESTKVEDPRARLSTKPGDGTKLKGVFYE